MEHDNKTLPVDVSHNHKQFHFGGGVKSVIIYNYLSLFDFLRYFMMTNQNLKFSDIHSFSNTYPDIVQRFIFGILVLSFSF